MEAYMKAYAKKLADLSMIEQKYLKAIENLEQQPSCATVASELQPAEENVVHITATALASP